MAAKMLADSSQKWLQGRDVAHRPLIAANGQEGVKYHNNLTNLLCKHMLQSRCLLRRVYCFDVIGCLGQFPETAAIFADSAAKISKCFHV